ncbi:MAG TPA: class I SAM-dependent methyltransferase [Candidatus Acidoferrales bacterium]|nr:class I SAM-dependent methyltransferase [Candidatus Acidoferrales bacterium]
MLSKPSLPMPSKRDWPLVGWSFLPEACLGLELLVNEARLGRDESVLDIGCGLGRMAYVLCYYLSPKARYEGIEPVGRWVRWNKAVLGHRFRNFHFKQLPVQNPLYNPGGKLKPARVRFPYPDAAFDIAFAMSVFQHNQAVVARHYLSEIARVLRPGGRCLITCFLLDAKPPSGAPKKGSMLFPYPVEDGWTMNRDLPEAGIVFLERDFRCWAAEQGLVVHSKWDGSWRGRGLAKLYQDMVILKKRDAARSSSRVL